MLTLFFITIFLSFVNIIEAQVPFETPIAYNTINTNVYCGYHTDCVIDCRTARDHSYRGVSCAGAQIDGTDARSLTVKCDDSNGTDSGCKGTSITCPFDDGSGDTKCSVLCSNDNQEVVAGACEDVFISVYTNRNLGSLYVECNGTNSCKRMSVNCPSDGAHKCNIQCKSHEGDASCPDMKVYPISYITRDNWLDLECDEGECDGLQFICIDQYHWNSQSKKVTLYHYNEQESEYECEDDECCPFVSSNVTGIFKSDLKQDEDNKGESMMIPLIVVSILLLFMCLVSAFLMFLLQKQKIENHFDAPFVELKEEA